MLKATASTLINSAVSATGSQSPRSRAATAKLASSSSSRFTANASGFLKLEPILGRAAAVHRAEPFATLAAELARMAVDDIAVMGEVFVQAYTE
jgi:hypothetical protein